LGTRAPDQPPRPRATQRRTGLLDFSVSATSGPSRSMVSRRCPGGSSTIRVRLQWARSKVMPNTRRICWLTGDTAQTPTGRPIRGLFGTNSESTKLHAPGDRDHGGTHRLHRRALLHARGD